MAFETTSLVQFHRLQLALNFKYNQVLISVYLSFLKYNATSQGEARAQWNEGVHHAL